MGTPDTGEELLSYRVIALSSLPLLLPTQTEQCSEIFSSFTGGQVHDAVELRETADFFSALFFFLWLRRTVPEICYRPELETVGVVVFSIYAWDEKLRPVWVKEILELSQEEIEQVEGLAKEVSFNEGVIDIVSVWENVKQRCPKASERALIELFDILTEDKQEVSLEGVIPLLPALLTVNYLVALRKTVTWNGMVLR